MGNILRGLKKQEPVLDVFLDFENASPKEDEDEVHQNMIALLGRGKGYLERLQTYMGCSNQIREAFQKPGEDTENVAWQCVAVHMIDIKEMWDFAVEFECTATALLKELNNGVDAKTNLEEKQALAKVLADTMDFVLKFDELKMRCPQIMNDFSYFRRVCKRKGDSNPISADDQFGLSGFLSHSSPMLNALSNAIKSLMVSDEGSKDLLAQLANICYSMIKSEKYTSENAVLFCLRTMTACIIIFDHVDSNGAFIKKGPINSKQCIQLLLKCKLNDDGDRQTLLNGLRYNTIHLKDDTTPKSITEMLKP